MKGTRWAVLGLWLVCIEVFRSVPLDESELIACMGFFFAFTGFIVGWELRERKQAHTEKEGTAE